MSPRLPAVAVLIALLVITLDAQTTRVTKSATTATTTSPTTRPAVNVRTRLREWHAEVSERSFDHFPDYSFYLRSKLGNEQWQELRKELMESWQPMSDLDPYI